MRYLVVVEEGPVLFGAYVPDLPVFVAAVVTRDEVSALNREAIGLHLKGLKQAGQPVPAASSAGEVVDVEAG